MKRLREPIGLGMDPEIQAKIRRQNEIKDEAARQERIRRRAEEDERDRRSSARATGWKAAFEEYRRLGGRGHLPDLNWAPEPDPDEDPFEGLL